MRTYLPKNFSLIYIGLLIGLVLGCYGRALDNNFIADGWGHIGAAMRGEFLTFFDMPFWLMASYCMYRPLAGLDFLIAFKLFGFDPYGIYLVDILIHAANVVMVFFVSRQLLRNIHICFLTALLFAVFRMHVGAVYWCGTEESSATFFILFCLLSYAGYLKRQSILLYILAVVSFFAALFTKEIGLTLIGILALYELMVHHQGSIRQCFGDTRKTALFLLLKYVPFAMILSVNLMIHQIIKESSFQNYVMQPSWGIHILRNILYLGQILLESLGSFTKVTMFDMFTQEGFIPNKALIMVVILGICAVLSLRKPRLNFILTLCLIVYLPQAIVGGNIMFQSRYLYWPAIPFLILLGAVYEELIRRFTFFQRRSVHIAALTIASFTILCHAYAAFIQEEIWDMRSQYTQDVVRQLENETQDLPEGSTVVFIGVPRGIDGEATNALELKGSNKGFQFIYPYDPEDPNRSLPVGEVLYLFKYRDDLYERVKLKWQRNREHMKPYLLSIV